jgi:hypothetical protein
MPATLTSYFTNAYYAFARRRIAVGLFLSLVREVDAPTGW